MRSSTGGGSAGDSEGVKRGERRGGGWIYKRQDPILEYKMAPRPHAKTRTLKPSKKLYIYGWKVTLVTGGNDD